jgi:hypothetical protein
VRDVRQAGAAPVESAQEPRLSIGARPLRNLVKTGGLR